MDKDQVRRLYDAAYASAYDGKFIESELAKPESEHEVAILAQLLKPGVRWLDVACGTGYFLGRFPQQEREGLDLSPAMLALARQVNPGVPFHEGDFLVDRPEWHDHWGLVSCMWYAYGLVNTLDEVAALIANLARWTAAGGTCFVPLADPRLIAGVDLPLNVEYPMAGSRIQVSGIVWSFIEDDDAKVHTHQLAPSIDWLVAEFRRHFTTVDLQTYPSPHRSRARAASWAWKRAERSRIALVASGKQSTRSA